MNSTPEISPTAPRPQRRTGLAAHLLALAALSAAALCALRALGALNGRAYLAELQPWLPAYLALSGGLWALVWGIVGWMLWRGARSAPAAAGTAAVLFSLHLWAERLLSYDPERWAGWPFALLFNLAALAVLALVLVWLARRADTGD